MTFLHTRDGIALTSTCTLCGMSTRSLSESAIYPWQRAHSWEECHRVRLETAQAVAEPDVTDLCRNGHVRAGNTSIDKRGSLVCDACRHDRRAAKRTLGESRVSRYGATVFAPEQGRMGSAKTTRPARKRLDGSEHSIVVQREESA